MYNALIRTHHVTSRRKLARIRKAAQKLDLARVLVRSGGSPGLMYVEGSAAGVQTFVEAVQNLRYKDFQVVRKTAAMGDAAGGEERNGDGDEDGDSKKVELEEVESVAAFAAAMQKSGVLEWWRKAMGYTT